MSGPDPAPIDEAEHLDHVAALVETQHQRAVERPAPAEEAR